MRNSKIYFWGVVFLVMACKESGPYAAYERAPVEQVEELLGEALAGREVSYSSEGEMSISWRLSECPMAYHYGNINYIQTEEPATEHSEASVRTKLVERRAEVGVRDDLPQKERTLSLEGMVLRDEGDIWQDQVLEKDRAVVQTTGSHWTKKGESPDIWDNALQQLIFWPALKPRIKVGEKIKWQIYAPKADPRKRQSDSGTQGQAFNLMPEAIELVAEKIVTFNGSQRALLLSADVALGSDEFSSPFDGVPGLPARTNLSIKNKGSFAARYLVSEGGQLLWSGVCMRIDSEVHRGQHVNKVRQMVLSELRHRASCLGAPLAEPAPLVYTKEGRSQHEMVLFFQALSPEKRRGLGEFFKENGLSAEQNKKNLKALQDYLDAYGKNALGRVEDIRPTYDKAAKKYRMLKKLDKSRYGVELETSIVVLKDFDVQEDVKASITYQCQDEAQERCGVRTIEVKAEEGGKSYLKIGEGAPEFVKRSHGVVYADAQTRLPAEEQDGLTWKTAYGDLQAALDLAGKKARPNEPWEVWATEGVYYPSIDDNGNKAPKENKDKTFVPRDWVSLHGGFKGGEQSKEERKKEARSILDGDLGKKGNTQDNAFNVVTIKGVTVSLTQVTIRNGKANAHDIVPVKEYVAHRSSFNVETNRYNQHHEWNYRQSKRAKGAGIFADDATVYLWASDVVDNWSESSSSAIYGKMTRIKITGSRISRNFCRSILSVIMLVRSSFLEMEDTQVMDNKTDGSMEKDYERELIDARTGSRLKIHDDCVATKGHRW